MRIRITTALTVLLGALGFPTAARAAICDLTSLGSTCINFAGATFTNAIPQPTGTGFIDPFLRLQASSSEQGYNTGVDWDPATGGDQFQFDQKNPSFDGDPLVTSSFLGYTRALALSEVPIVTVGGTKYREFWLDINEPNGSKSLLSLDQLQIFLSNSSSLGVMGTSDYSTSTRKLAGLSAIYDMDSGCSGAGCENGSLTDNWVKMDYSLGSGSGSGDMTLLIPDSLFKGGKYVYLYSKFGVQACCTSADGFEEWWVRETGGGGGGGGQAAVPEPASLVLLGTGLVIVGNRFRKQRKPKSPTIQ